jgi:hypothetical protein
MFGDAILPLALAPIPLSGTLCCSTAARLATAWPQAITPRRLGLL